MNLDFNELYVTDFGGGMILPSKMEHAEGQDPLEWLKKEIEKKPAKLVRQGQIIGEIKDFDMESGKMDITYYDKPIPVLTESDFDDILSESDFDDLE